MTTQCFHYSFSPSLLRTFTAIPLSALVTCALLFGMYLLIKNDHEYIEKPAETLQIANPFLKDPGPIEAIVEKPVRPPEPLTEPAMPTTEIIFDPVAPIGVYIERVQPPKPTGIQAFAGGDQLMPFIKIQPAYPARASERGIEGFVDVIFDVTAIGTTENIRIIYAEPSNIFNSSVIKAIKSWKYKPKMVNDVAAKAFDVRERITFKLD